MTDPTARNRLDEEESPYLRQHADNPVHWQPWDQTALGAARERDVPIFLSVGYSACHWCHVMEEESFQDEDVAAVLNERYVPIKVDREERPDVDRIYQTICQLVTGQGGWPLSAWLTPEGEPFYVGTYFPREAKQGRPGFPDLADGLADSWESDREEIENRAGQWTASLRDNLEATPESPGDPPEAEALADATAAAIRSADGEYGGFGTGGPKFPQARRIELLLRAYVASGRDPALDVATDALDAMAAGGLYDHLGGGFHRYATDRQWRVPHFEKMLYDNAELPAVYLAAHRVTGADRYAEVARETFAFLERELQHPEGGFYSTLDARSGPPAGRDGGPEEGAFYVWTPAEVRDALDDEATADLVCDCYGISEGGNFEGGTSVLAMTASVEALAEDHGLDAETVADRLGAARESLFAARSGRPRPARDEKVLAGWNGLAVSAFAAGGLVLGPDVADPGGEALGFVRDRLWDETTGELSRRFKDGDVKGRGYLEDYAFLGRGAFDLYQATGEVDHLAFALDLARTITREFWDEDDGTLYFTPASGESLVTRPQELHDQSTPSSVGVATSLLLALDHFAPEAEFGTVAERVLATHRSQVESNPLESVSLALAADEHARGSVELTVAADELPEEWRRSVAGRYLPTGVVARRPADAAEMDRWLDVLDLAEMPPIWADREARDGEPTAYACKSFTCSPPTHDVDEALDWLVENT